MAGKSFAGQLFRVFPQTPMRIAYLHISPEQKYESGIARYGRYIAQAVAQLPETNPLPGTNPLPCVETKEQTLLLSDRQPFRAPLKKALKELKDYDVLHLQYSKYLGLTGWKKLQLLKMIRRRFKGKICVTLHDIYLDLYPAYDVKEAWGFENKRLRGFSKGESLALRSTVTCLWQNHLADKAIMRWMLTHIDQILVSNQAEAERLQHFEGADQIHVIPHFVEERSTVITSAEAKQKLGLTGPEKIVTLQGFIYRSKGHALLLDALSLLPPSIKVIFAGGMAPNQAAMERELKAQIQRLNLEERVTTTGYLSEQDLELYLAASDLAVCPFQIVSASGSLSTWISMGRPILAYDLPQVQELNQWVPGAIATFSDYTPESLAAAIQAYFVQDSAEQEAAQANVTQLQGKLSLKTIAQAHLEQYRPSQGLDESSATA